MRCHLRVSVCPVLYSVCCYMSVSLYRQTVNMYAACVYLCSKLLLYMATLFYLTAVSYHFPSVRLNNETTTCNGQHVYLMWRLSTSWRKQSAVSSSNMGYIRLIPHIELKRADPDSLLIAVTALAVLPAVTSIAVGEEWCELSDKVMSIY